MTMRRARSLTPPADIRRAVRAIACDMLQREKLEAWLADYPALPVAEPRRVLVVMAGNIPLVGFFDLLCVLVSGHGCLVKPSAKDSVLMEHVVGLLREIDPSAPVRLYDAGLADDIWAYSGLGCRSVSLIFAPEGYEPALQIPPVNDKYINNYRQQRALLEMQGRPFVDLGCAVAVEQCAFPAALSRIAYAHYATLDEVAAWLAGHDGELQCVVTGCLPHSRRAGFGCAQSPALTDYPDDRDVLAWLAALD